MAATSAVHPVLAQTGGLPLVGVLMPNSESFAQPALNNLREGLRGHGLVPDRTIRLVVRYADNNAERLEGLGRELKELGCVLIVTVGTTSVSAAQRAAPGLPIVTAGSADPVLTGFAASLARPGGRITGISILGEELVSKQFQVLKELVPGAPRFATFLQSANPANPVFRDTLRRIGTALGIQIDVRELRTSAEFPAAFAEAVRQSISGVHVYQDPAFNAHHEEIFRSALAHRLPSVVGNPQWARAGAVVAYAVDILKMWNRSARYVSEILRGADPATLPIEQPNAFDVVINMKSARALGVTIPPSILASATEVIE